MDILFTLLAATLGGGFGWLIARKPRFARANDTHSHVSLEGMRAVGELSVFKVIYQRNRDRNGLQFW